MHSPTKLSPRTLWLAALAGAALTLACPAAAETGSAETGSAGPAPQPPTPAASATPDSPTAAPAAPDAVDAGTSEEASVAAIAPTRRALMAAIDAAFESEAARLHQLRGQLAQAPDAMSALAIQRQIDAVKQQTEIAILELQLDHAQSEGRQEDAQQLALTLEQLRQPQPPRRPVDRPVPHQN